MHLKLNGVDFNIPFDDKRKLYPKEALKKVVPEIQSYKNCNDESGLKFHYLMKTESSYNNQNGVKKLRQLHSTYKVDIPHLV